MKVNYKLLFAGSVLAIGVMALLAGSVNEREAERIELATSPSIPAATA